jgi:hypothetical protein
VQQVERVVEVAQHRQHHLVRHCFAQHGAQREQKLNNGQPHAKPKKNEKRQKENSIKDALWGEGAR